MFKKLIAAGAALAVAIGIVALATVPAQAHTGDLSVNAVCNTSTGQYDFTATLAIAKTNESGSSLWKVGTSTFEHTPKQTDAAFTNGPVISTNNPSTITLTKFSLPGDTKGKGPWVYAQTTFKGDNYFVGSDGQLLNDLKGDCTQPVTPAAVSHTDGACISAGKWSNGSYTIPDGKGAYSISQVRNGVTSTPGAGTYSDAKNGDTFQWTAVAIGNTKLTSTNLGTWTAKTPTGTDCDQPAGAPSVGQTAAVCTAAGTVGTGTFTIGAVAQGVNVSYTVGGKTTTLTGPNAGATLTGLAVGSTVKVDISGQQGYTVTPSSTTYTIDGPSASQCVVPGAPTFTDANCTVASPGVIPVQGLKIGASNGVTYTWTYTSNGKTVTGSGDSLTTTKANAPDANTKVTVTAAPKNSSFFFPAGTTTSWEHTYPVLNSTGCVAGATAGKVTTQELVCSTTTPGAFTQGFYEIDSAVGVTYLRSLNGSTPTDAVPAGDLDHPIKVDPGTKLRIIATVDPKLYDLSGTTAWSLDYVKDQADCLTVTPKLAEPTLTEQTCTPDSNNIGVYDNPSITIPTTEHVTYLLDNKVVTAGTYDVTVKDQHTVTVRLDDGYKLPADSTYPTGGWTFSPKAAPVCGDITTHPVVDPAVASTQAGCFTQGSYTLSSDLDSLDPTAVMWTVNGSPVNAGTYKVSGAKTLTITAAPNTKAGYGFDATAQTSWTLTFAAATACDLKTLALTGTGNPAGWIGLGYLLLVLGTALIAIPMIRRRRSAE
jgi:hypothetical protein